MNLSFQPGCHRDGP